MTVRVLVVDDSVDVRRLLIAIIDGHDNCWSVVGEAADGQQAIEIAAATQPDLVLLDLSMPVMDGLEALPLILLAAPAARRRRAERISQPYRTRCRHHRRCRGLSGEESLGVDVDPAIAQLLPGIEARPTHPLEPV